MNKQINTALAIAVIIIIAVVMGGIIYFSNVNKNQTSNTIVRKEASAINAVKNEPNSENSEKIKNSCLEGENNKATSDMGKLETTANWKIYKNDKLGFTLKYPTGWFIKDDVETSRIYISNEVGDVAIENTPTNYQMIWISYSQDDVNSVISWGNNECQFMKIINSNGFPIYIYEMPYSTEDNDTYNTTRAMALWSNGDKNYSADMATPRGEKNQKDETKILKSVLSTFKFIK